MGMTALDVAATSLLIVGGLAWGAFAFGYEPVAQIFGPAAKFVYGVVGVAAVHSILRFAKLY